MNNSTKQAAEAAADRIIAQVFSEPPANESELNLVRMLIRTSWDECIQHLEHLAEQTRPTDGFVDPLVVIFLKNENKALRDRVVKHWEAEEQLEKQNTELRQQLADYERVLKIFAADEWPDCTPKDARDVLKKWGKE